jgi:hypothetical protein
MRASLAPASASRGWAIRGYHVEAEGLALYRIFYAAVYLIALFPRYSWIAAYPDAFWDPPVGPFALARGFPSASVFTALEWSLAAALFALLIGYRTRWASLAVGALLIVGDGFVYSILPTSHLILAPLVPLVLAFSGWGSAWSIDALKRRASRPQSSWPITLLMLLIGLSFFHAGVAKAAGGWLRSDASVVAWYVERFSRDAVGLQSALANWVSAAPPTLHESMDRATVILETGMLVAVLIPKVGRIFIAGAAIFHLGVFLLLDIEFAPLLLVYAVLLPWDRVAKRPRTIAPPGKGARWTVARRPVLSMAGFTCLFMAFVTLLGPPLRGARSPFDEQSWGTSFALLAIGACVAITYLVSITLPSGRKRRHFEPRPTHLVELDVVMGDVLGWGAQRLTPGAFAGQEPSLRVGPSPRTLVRHRSGTSTP